MKPAFTFIFLIFCLQALPQNPQIMFPGDLNNDGVANQYDILPLGIAIFDEGFPRELSDIHWIEHSFFTWDQVLPVTGINYGFIDSDGNGFIDTTDITAILVNYDSIQNTSIPEPKPLFFLWKPRNLYGSSENKFHCPINTFGFHN